MKRPSRYVRDAIETVLGVGWKTSPDSTGLWNKNKTGWDGMMGWIGRRYGVVGPGFS